MKEDKHEMPLGPTQEELFEALEESVKLQSNYASLLNMYDGGMRLQFKSVHEWIERLRYLKTRKS